MSLDTLTGGASFAFIFICIACTIVVSLGVVTIFSIFYHRYFFPRVLFPSYDETFTPRCSVILPCKGVPYEFERNIRSFLELDYPNYEVVYCVESAEDAAVPIINKVIAKDDRASLVIAGMTKTCSQKNHNMLAAIEKTNNPDVYVFADSDIRPLKHWLRELIRPLSKKEIAVATGFRWLYSSSGKLGEIANAYQNCMLLVLFSFASFVKDVGLWGGSMAIKKKDFEELKVKEFWAQTVVDDNSLSRLIMKSSKKSVMVTNCITPTDDALKTVRQSVRWFERQCMFLKAYQRPLWYVAVLLVVACLSLQILLPVSIGMAYFTDSSFLAAGGASALIFLFGTMATALFYPMLGKHPTYFRFLLFQPISLFTVLISFLRTIFTNTVVWSGFHYKLNYRGKVIAIEHNP